MANRLNGRRLVGGTGALALLAGGLLGSGAAPSLAHSAAAQAPPVAIAGAPLATDPPRLIYDAAAGAATSLAAGTTNYLIEDDLNGDTFPDLVNVTGRGAQVFLNRGTIGGVFTLERIQDLTAAEFSWGGGSLDIDFDGDVDLVLGSLNSIVVALNDGTGHFTTSNNFLTGWGVPTLAQPFRTQVAGGSVFVVIAAAAEQLTNDAVGPNPSRQPLPYVLRYQPVGNTFTVVEQLSRRINADGITIDDLDFDGDNDVLITNRSNTGSGLPFHVFRNQNGPSAPFFPETLPFDFTGAGFNFGFGASVGNNGDILYGSWHRGTLLRYSVPPAPAPLLDPAAGWQTPESVPLDPNGSFPTGEVFQTALADMDHDGFQDVVLMGASTPLVFVEINGAQQGNRFTGLPVQGRTFDFQVADWDVDLNSSRDVISGGEKGLYFHRNVNGGAAGTPGAPPEPPATPCSVYLQRAYFGITTLLDPTRDSPLDSISARGFSADAQGRLDRIDPRFIDHDALPGSMAGDLAALNAYLDLVNQAEDDMEDAQDAAFNNGERDGVRDILAIRQDLADSAVCVNEEIVDASDGNSAKRAPVRRPAGRRIVKQRQKMLRDRDGALDAVTAARIATDETARGEHIDEALRLATRSIRRGIRILRHMR